MLTTTFNLLRKAGACTSRYRVLARHLGGVQHYGATTPIPLSTILDSNGLDDALWCLQCCQDKETAGVFARLLVADFAWHVLHIFEEKYPNDKRPRQAIDAARQYARGEIGDAALDAAGDAARAAAWDAALDAAGDAAWDAARAAAWDAARDAAWDAARDAENRLLRIMVKKEWNHHSSR